jgi:hypothetical protein
MEEARRINEEFAREQAEELKKRQQAAGVLQKIQKIC